jgi:uncharacterized protein (UPF0548 family)
MVAGQVLPNGFLRDHNRRKIGSGAEAFALAKRAIQSWRMFPRGWLEVCPHNAPIVEGTTVGILARTMGMWTLNPARIVAVMDETGPIEKFGFAYGSLPGHAEAGEEQFSVEWHHGDDSVWFDLDAISRPGRWFTWLGHPYTRRIQKRFAVDSMAAMAAYVASGGES